MVDYIEEQNEVSFDKRERIMAKKSVAQKFREFLDASPDESNVPMTRGEIATAVAKKKRKAATKNRPLKSAAKKNVAKKSTSKSSENKKKSKRG